MIDYLVMDIDGTLTDGKIYMGPSGEAMKAFSVKDGYVINYILKPHDIVPIVITGRSSAIVKRRCEELGIYEIHQGQLDKLAKLKEIVGEENLAKCSYFGDDILDLQCMLSIREAGGVIGCPADAVDAVKAISDYVCTIGAGEGALREFVEWLVIPRVDKPKIKEEIYQALQYLLGLDVSSVEIGKTVLVNDKLSFTVQKYLTRPEEECILESHRDHVDIQIILKGKEAIDIVDTSRLTVKEQYHKAKDVVIWEPPETMGRMMIHEGDSIILYPENAHRGAIRVNDCSEVIKIVGKFKL